MNVGSTSLTDWVRLWVRANNGIGGNLNVEETGTIEFNAAGDANGESSWIRTDGYAYLGTDITIQVYTSANPPANSSTSLINAIGGLSDNTAAGNWQWLGNGHVWTPADVGGWILKINA